MEKNPEKKQGRSPAVVALSVELAALIGKPVRPPSNRGFLANDKGEELHWFKCPHHDTWLQPEWRPFDHWKCAVDQCKYIRAAKMRTRTERHIFRSMQWIEEHG